MNIEFQSVRPLRRYTIGAEVALKQPCDTSHGVRYINAHLQYRESMPETDFQYVQYY